VLYLLDANILITAANTYYGITRVPEFWSWLEHQGGAGYIKMPLEIYEEILEGRKEGDELLDWVKKDAIRKALLFDEASNADLVRKTVREGYGNDLTDGEVEKIGRDPFLISYGLVDGNRCIVTTEVSKPTRTRHNRHIPGVCTTLKVNCCGPWDLNKNVGFKTGWKS
jgi:hypothetical protein